ncbi:MAG: class I mannose-6-phosphate isomerase [Deltaproteobacteria bacterium]|nr:class I mannose-6-phosphate isomerase [Deltaproteobacteria bacterium]
MSILSLPLKLRFNNFTSPQRTPWGGTRIADLKNHLGVAEGTIIGESWEISGHPELPSHVGMTSLNELIRQDPISLLGQRIVDRFGPELPFLVKLLDTRDWLSVQVHPKADYPGLKPGEHSKNEAWVILETSQNPPNPPLSKGGKGGFSPSGIYFGFKEGVTRKDAQSALEDGSDLTRFLNFVPVQPGDVYFVQAGVPHAIGPGLFLYEIQETSSTTYRYFDFNRRDKNGNPRQLHKEDAVAATDWNLPWGGKLLSQLKIEPYGNRLLSTPYFEVSKIELKRGATATGDSSGGFHGITVLKGELRIKTTSSQIQMNQGESAIIPAAVGRYSIISSTPESFTLLAKIP